MCCCLNKKKITQSAINNLVLFGNCNSNFESFLRFYHQVKVFVDKKVFKMKFWLNSDNTQISNLFIDGIVFEAE